MCGGGGNQTITQKTELDPNLQRLLYGGIFQGPAAAQPAAAAQTAMSGGGDGPMWSDGMSPSEIRAAQSYGQRSGVGMPSDPGRAGFGGTREGSMSAGGMYAMGGMVTPQQGIASLNQGQMPMMGGQLPNLSDPMTAATLAMAMRGPQMQYGDIMGPPMGFAMGGYVEGPGTGTSDSIDAVIMQNGTPVQEALLSDGEFVMTERAVRGAGNGDREKGAAKMYEMMRQFERGGRV
jgi:hypothetical protein